MTDDAKRLLFSATDAESKKKAAIGIIRAVHGREPTPEELKKIDVRLGITPGEVTSEDGAE